MARSSVVKRAPIWKISVVTTAEAEDAVAESLSKLFGCPASTHNDFRNGKTTVSIFLKRQPVSLARSRHAWKQIVANLKVCGLRVGAGILRTQKLPGEDWAESWKRHFKPFEIGKALLVKPSWIKRKPQRGQAVVVLDPGLSFGTGQHPTTSFCLHELVRQRKPNTTQSFLDIGTGSGILAIAAAKLGYAPVHAFDFDPESVRVAHANAKRNRVDGKLTIAQRDLCKKPPARRYDVVCANLISTLLIAEQTRITGLVKKDGVLVVAGILVKEFVAVRSAFESLGLRMGAQKIEKEWKSGTFVRLREF